MDKCTLEVGYIFFNCRLTAAEGVTKCFLGRPWRPYAKTIFINCELGEHIRPEGWESWSNKENPSTTYYGEYGSKGKGANKKGRVDWSHQLTKKEAQALIEKYMK